MRGGPSRGYCTRVTRGRHADVKLDPKRWLSAASAWHAVSSPSNPKSNNAVQLLSFYLSFPRRHDFLETRRSVPPLLLQQFAWAEDDVPRRRAARRAALVPAIPPSPSPPAAALSAASPLFCFETAIKLFFWSVLVYAYQEEAESGDVSLAAMPAPIHELLGEMDAAMRLYGLRKRRLFYDRACGTKALVAWSDSIILLSFRGSAERANFWQDARVRPPPPEPPLSPSPTGMHAPLPHGQTKQWFDRAGLRCDVHARSSLLMHTQHDHCLQSPTFPMHATNPHACLHLSAVPMHAAVFWQSPCVWFRCRSWYVVPVG